VSADVPGVVGRLVFDADPIVDEAVDAALAAAGFDIMQIDLGALGDVFSAAMTVLDAEAWVSDQALVATAPDLIGADVLHRLRAASEVSPGAVATAREELDRWRGTLDLLWRRVELLAVPTLRGFPPRLENAQDMHRIRGLTSPVNAAGLPALALPVPSAGPLPASIQLIGPSGSEERLLAAGALLELAVRQ